MGKFVFPLESLLEVKRSLEEKAAVELSAMLMQLALVEQEMEELKRTRKRVESELAAEESRKFNYSNALLYREYLAAIGSQLDLLENQLKQHQQALEEQRDKLKRTRREKMVIERLKAKMLEDFLIKEGRREQKELDELHLIVLELNR